MARYLRIANGIVLNAELWDTPPSVDGFTFIASALGGPGWLWDGTTLAAPPPPPLPVPETISDRQFFQQLALLGVITAAEALAAVKTGDMPAALQTYIDTLPSDAQFAAEMLISGATVFERSYPMTIALGAGMGWTSDQLDDLWRAAAAL